MSQVYFKKLPHEMREISQKQRLLDAVRKGLQAQMERPLNTINLDLIQLMPKPVQIVYWLWLFQCEAGVGSMEQFILDQLGLYAPQIHEALKVVGANRLAQLVEEAAALARGKATAEFTQLTDQSWFNQFLPTGDFPTLQSLNKPTFALMDSLADLTSQYIRSNEHVFFEK